MERSLVIDALMHFLPDMSLGAGQLNEKALELLDKITLDGLFAPHNIRDRAAALACLAGLRLLINDVDGAHKIAQDLHTPEGSYWHAIVHRRDGDFWNAKYWIRKVGLHPVYLELGSLIKELVQGQAAIPPWMSAGHWDPYAFVDEVERSYSQPSKQLATLQQVQTIEWKALFDYCFEEAGEAE